MSQRASDLGGLFGLLRRMGWVEHVARMGKMRNAYRILVRNSEEKRPLARSKRRWEDD
jgi:hypothetical protein